MMLVLSIIYTKDPMKSKTKKSCVKNTRIKANYSVQTYLLVEIKIIKLKKKERTMILKILMILLYGNITALLFSSLKAIY